MQSKTNIKISNSSQTQDMFPILIKICQNYLSEEDLDSLMKNTYPSSNIIFKINGNVPIIKSKYVCFDYDFTITSVIDGQKFPFPADNKNPSLDFLFAIDLLNKIKNLEPLIKDIGSLIKPQGLFAFTYHRVRNKYLLGQKENDLKSTKNQKILYSHYDGYVQKLLLNNHFYIQNEFEGPVDNQKNIEVVLIVAQKKNHNN